MERIVKLLIDKVVTWTHLGKTKCRLALQMVREGEKKCTHAVKQTSLGRKREDR